VYPQINFVWRVVVRVSAHAPCGHLRPSAWVPHGRRAAFTPRVWRRSDWTRRSRTRPCRFHCRSGFCWSCRCFVFGFCPLSVARFGRAAGW